MNEFDVKKTMEQVHISPEMQEEIIMNIQKRMENKRVWNWRKMVTVAAAFVMTAGVVSLPVRAFVESVVKERMENIPTEEVKELGDIIQNQAVLADGFSREYSDKEKERSKELWQEYKNGTFPKKDIQQVDDVEAVTEGTLCYIKTTGVFNLPDHEMTDEEILEIIDFQHKMSYAIEQRVTDEEKAKYGAEEARLKKMVQDANGISEEEAIEIARKQMESEIGERAKGKELMTDRSGCGAQLEDISNKTDYEHKGDVAYNVGFGNADSGDTYTCLIDAVDGRVLGTWDYIATK